MMLAVRTGILAEGPAERLAESYVALAVAAGKLTSRRPAGGRYDYSDSVRPGLIRLKRGQLLAMAGAASRPAEILRRDRGASQAVDKAVRRVTQRLRRSRPAGAKQAKLASQIALALLGS